MTTRSESSRPLKPCWRFALLLPCVQLGCSADVAGLPVGPPPAAAPPDAGTVTEPPRSEAPAVKVEFPSAVSLTDATSITIRGSASDEDGVRSVRINGVLVDTSGDFASWERSAPLSPGENVFVIESEDRAGNADSQAARIVVRSEPLLYLTPDAVAVDAAGRRALVVDLGRQLLAAVDLETGDRTLVSGESRGEGPPLSPFMNQIAFDAENGRAIVVDSPGPFRPNDGAIVEIDLETGDRAIVSDPAIGTGPFFSGAVGVAVDAGRHRALVFAQSGDGAEPPFETWALIAIDLRSGDRTIVSNPSKGTGRSLLGASGMTLDVAQRRALVTLPNNGYTALVAIDLETGDRSSITDPATEFGVGYMPRGLVLDTANHRVFTVANADPERTLVAIDLDSGERTVVRAKLGTVLGFGAIAFDDLSGRPIVVAAKVIAHDLRAGELLSVDPDAEVSAPISAITAGAGPAIASPSDVSFDSVTGRALVVDRLRGLIAVDLATSDRSIVHDLRDLGSEAAALSPSHLALDEAHRRAIVVGSRAAGASDRIVSIDLSTGDPAPIDGPGVEWTSSRGIALDAARNRALVTTFEGPGGVALATVDLSTGARDEMITFEPGRGPSFIFDGVAIDAAKDRALVIDYLSDALIAVDLARGVSTTLSESSAGTRPSFGRWGGGAAGAIVLDDAGENALALGAELISVNLATGDRTVLSAPGAGPTQPTGVARSSSPRTALITDDGLDALVLVDLVQGERVIVSGHTIAE
jgi:DNA-binding beta-propeller fold protein YncE